MNRRAFFAALVALPAAAKAIVLAELPTDFDLDEAHDPEAELSPEACQAIAAQLEKAEAALWPLFQRTSVTMELLAKKKRECSSGPARIVFR